MSSKAPPFPLESLPEPVLDQVLSYLSYDELANLRRVNKKFNSTIMRLLNNGFRSAERFHAKYLEVSYTLFGKNIFFYPKYVQEVKSQLPRRESQRRNHQLYRHYSILTSMGTRISLLSLTFKEYVDSKRCCFIPGKVIDEIFSILRRIKEDQNPPRSSEILQELEDLSTMARDHFETKMVPTLGPEINPFQGMIDSFNSIKETVAIQNKTVASQNKKISQLTKEYKETVASLKKEFKETVASQNKKIVEQNKKIVEQNKKIVEMEEKLAGKRGKENRKRTREMESPAELESKMTTRYHLRKRKITSD